MNKTTYFYPKFLEFQIVRRGPQMTPSPETLVYKNLVIAKLIDAR